MIIKSLRVQNFRIHDDFLLDFSSKTTLIFGKNGSGKTSLLEAIYLLLQGTSFRSSDKEILKKDCKKNWFRIDLETETGEIRTIKFDISSVNKKKQFEIDGNISFRLAQQNKFPVVLFEPDDLQLLSGSPARRRRFLDDFLAQIYPSFALAQKKYDKAVKQRNNLLKQANFSNDLIFPWNLILAESGSEIISRRIEFVERLNSQVNWIYSEISGVNDGIVIKYNCEALTSSNELLKALSASVEKDKLLGFTSFGPHRHDLAFEFNSADANNVASRGEARSLILALKFLETDILAELSGKKPIVLLDDVFSELDEDRQNLLAKHFSKYQTIISSVSSIEGVGREINL